MVFKAQESLSEQVARHLAEEIITGELLAGDRIQEQRYAKELEVSRGTMREALLLLEKWYLIQLLPRRGAIVTEMSEDHVIGLYETVQSMMNLVVRKAMDNATEADLANFVATVHGLQEMAVNQQLDEFFEGSFDFFNSLYAYAVNGFIEDVLMNLQPALKRCFYMALHLDRLQMQQSLRFYKAIIEGFLRKDQAIVDEVMEAYIENQCELVLDALAREKQVEMAWAHRHNQ